MDQPARFPYRFFVVTFAWSWLIWLPLVLATAGVLPMEPGLRTTVTLPASLLAAFGPAIGAFYCLKTLHADGAVRQYLGGLRDFRLGWAAWLVPILVLGGITFLAWILPELWAEPRLPMLLPSVWVFLPYVVMMVLLGGGQEELGWRGYILDPLEARLGPWLGNLVLGLVWALWHLPLFFIAGTSQTFMPFAGFTLMLIGNSWFFAWVREVSGGRTWSGLIAHGLSNAFIPLFSTVVMVAGAAQPRFWIWVSLTFLMGVVTTALRTRPTRPTRPTRRTPELHRPDEVQPLGPEVPTHA